MNVLDAWEAKIKDSIEYHGENLCDDQKEFFRQKLALIKLVKNKDEILVDGIHVKYSDDPGMEEYYDHDPMVKALKLTEELK